MLELTCLLLLLAWLIDMYWTCRFKGGGQAAKTGFASHRWTEAQVVVLEGGMLAMMWMELQSCSLFTRLSVAARDPPGH